MHHYTPINVIDLISSSDDVIIGLTVSSYTDDIQ